MSAWLGWAGLELRCVETGQAVGLSDCRCGLASQLGQGDGQKLLPTPTPALTSSVPPDYASEHVSNMPLPLPCQKQTPRCSGRPQPRVQ